MKISDASDLNDAWPAPDADEQLKKEIAELEEQLKTAKGFERLVLQQRIDARKALLRLGR